MRMGDIDYLYKLKTTETDADTGRTDPPLTESQQKKLRWKNWWYYHKWHVACGVILTGILINLVGSYLGLWTKSPDLQLAYVGKYELPSDTVAALEQAFASLASDFNGDGEVIVKVNQYIYGFQDTIPEAASYKYANEVSLIGDISDCVSYIFLLDDPAQFQQAYQLLASPDGGCPDDADYGAEDKVILWSDCQPFAEMDLGTYSYSISGKTQSGNNLELLSHLSIGRRCFPTDKVTAYADQCSALWDMLSQASH